MTVDHINKYLFNGTLPYLFEAGRLAFPIFVFVLCYKLSIVENNLAAYKRVFTRLTVFGIISLIPLYLLSGNAAYTQLNVMFTLLSIVWVLLLFLSNTTVSKMFGCTVFILMGSLVEYGWIGIGLGISLYFFFIDRGLVNLLFTFLCVTALFYINDNFYALAVLPVILIIKNSQIAMPRYKWVFYAYYPAHLIVLAALRIPMSNSGYLFFT